MKRNWLGVAVNNRYPEAFYGGDNMRKLLITLMSIGMAGGLFAIDIENWSSTRNGTAKITTDGAGTATLTADAAIITDITVSDDLSCDDLTVSGGDIVGKTGTSIDLGEAAAGTATLTGTNITLSGTVKVGTLNGIIKGSTGTLSAATAGTDYLAPGADFTNSVAASITNLSISVVNGLVTSITINGTTTP